MLSARSMRLTTPFALLLASRVLLSSVSASPSRSFTMAASASGAVSGSSDAQTVKDLVVDVGSDFKPPSFKTERTIQLDVESKWQGEGVGARVRRSIGRSELRNLDPFLMLDEFSVGKPAGFPDHPHRGFETVTYMLEGTFMHEDFKGHRGIIGPGDLQWMTAGKGIMHSEVPMSDVKAHGLQLWVNLAAKNKMVEPNYQELLAKDIPKRRYNGVVANIIAGSAFGVDSPVHTMTPTMYIDFSMEGGSTLKQAIPAGWNGFVYVLEGSGVFGGHKGVAHHTLVLSNDGGEEGFTVTTAEGKACRFALIVGEPLNEPIVQHGPFVMNTREEIMKAMTDFQSGTNGFEGAAQWSSEGGKTFH